MRQILLFSPPVWALAIIAFLAHTPIQAMNEPETSILHFDSERLTKGVNLDLNKPIWHGLLYRDSNLQKTSMPERIDHSNPRSFVLGEGRLSSFNHAIYKIIVTTEYTTSLSFIVPELPHYRLTVNQKQVYQQGLEPFIPKRTLKYFEIGYDKRFEIELELVRPDDNWAPYTQFKIGRTEDVEYSHWMELIYAGFFIGFAGISAFYHFALSFMIPRNRTSLFFSIFLTCLVVRFGLSNESQIFVRLLPELSWEWSWKLGFIGYYLAIAAFVSFIANFFPKTMTHRPQLLIWTAAALMTVITFLTKVSTYAVLNNYYHLVTLSALIIVINAYRKAFIAKLPGTLLSLASILLLTFITIHDILIILQYLQTPPLVDYGIIVFIVSQTLIISLNFSRTFYQIIHTHRQLRKLVYPHVVDQISAGETLEKTMPTGKEQAVIIAFDIVNSTKIKHPDFLQILEVIMTRCQAVLSAGYDARTLASNGYRIKEMGDGLICSVGFPYHCPEQKIPEVLAVQIAEEFCRIFHEEIRSLHYPSPLHCAVGIASGPVEGFFPNSGIRQYDIRGHAIALATRYESMRNVVYDRTGRRSSIIFIQNAVYQKLDPKQMQRFQKWDCTLPGCRIRDDAKARQAWFLRYSESSELAFPDAS